MKEQILQWMLRHRLLVLVCLVLLTTTGCYFAASVTFDTRLDIFFLEGEETLTRYRKFLQQFESDERLVIALPSSEVFTTENLRVIERLTKKMEGVDHVLKVTSLTNVVVPQSIPGGVSIGSLIPTIPYDDHQLRAIREAALDSNMVKGTLISSRGDTAAIVLQLEDMQDRIKEKLEMLRQVRAILASEGKDETEYYMAGLPVLNEALFSYTHRDLAILVPLMLVLLTVVIALIFQRILPVALVLGVVVVTLVWTLGFMGLVRIKINIFSGMFAPFLLAIGIADSIHILSSYFECYEKGEKAKQAVVRAFSRVFTPCLLTTLTTGAGLLSLTVSRLAPVRQFGVVAAAGVFFAFLISMTLLPLALSFSQPFPVRWRGSYPIRVLMRFLGSLGRVGSQHPRLILALALIASLAALSSLRKLTVGVNYIETIGEAEPARKAMEFVDNRFGGTLSVEFMLEGTREDTFKDPAALYKMDTLESYVNALPGVTGSYSLARYLKEMNRLMLGGDAFHFTLPRTQELVAQYLLLMESTDGLNEIVQSDYSVARVSARIRFEDALALARKVQDVETYLGDHFTEPFHVQATGVVKILHDMEMYLFSSQIRTFSIAFFVILIMMGVMLRSLRLGLFAMIPNFLPVLLTIGIMSQTGISLDMGTVCIASILLGLVVDDTIHLLYRLRWEAQHDADVVRAIRTTIEGVGFPILSTSVILATGFSVLCLSKFQPNVHFGLLSATAVLMAFFADLVVLPAAIVALKPRLRMPEERIT